MFQPATKRRTLFLNELKDKGDGQLIINHESIDN